MCRMILIYYLLLLFFLSPFPRMVSGFASLSNDLCSDCPHDSNRHLLLDYSRRQNLYTIHGNRIVHLAACITTHNRSLLAFHRFFSYSLQHFDEKIVASHSSYTKRAVSPLKSPLASFLFHSRQRSCSISFLFSPPLLASSLHLRLLSGLANPCSLHRVEITPAKHRVEGRNTLSVTGILTERQFKLNKADYSTRFCPRFPP
jgi:hypothetical protein